MAAVILILVFTFGLAFLDWVLDPACICWRAVKRVRRAVDRVEKAGR